MSTEPAAAPTWPRLLLLFLQDGITVLRHPGVASFDSLHPRADLALAAGGTAAWGLVQALLTTLFFLELAALFVVLTPLFGLDLGELASLGPEGALFLVVFALVFLGVILVLTPFNQVMNLFLVSGALYLAARVAKGQGSFTVQTYLLGALLAAYYVAVAVLWLLPVLGWLLGLALFIYLAWPLTNCLRSVHHFSTGTAVLVWLAPLLAYVALVFLVTVPFLLLGLIAGLAEL